jgi:NADH:ubiquinone reductase (H+-translocating)
VLTNTLVKAVKQREVVIQKKGSDELNSIPCSVVIWATGIRARPLTNRLREIIGPKFQSNRMGLITDKYLRVKGVEDGSIYALGDCGTIEQPKLLDRLQSLFEEADKIRDGSLDLQEFQTLVEQNIDAFPQVHFQSVIY